MAPVRKNMDHASNKFGKLYVEKLRRERINSRIEKLRTLFHQILQMPEDHTFKLEKADILEMGVSFLKHKASSRANSSYARGFSLCLQETLRHVSLHAKLPHKVMEDIKRFYVVQRTSLRMCSAFQQHGHFSHISAKCYSSSTRVALWRPWKNN